MVKMKVKEITKLAQRVEDALIKEDFKTALPLIDDLIYRLQRFDKYTSSYLRLINKTDALKKKAEDEGLHLIDVIMSDEGW